MWEVETYVGWSTVGGVHEKWKTWALLPKGFCHIYSPQKEKEAPWLMGAHIRTVFFEGYSWSSLDCGKIAWTGWNEIAMRKQLCPLQENKVSLIKILFPHIWLPESLLLTHDLPSWKHSMGVGVWSGGATHFHAAWDALFKTLAVSGLPPSVSPRWL